MLRLTFAAVALVLSASHLRTSASETGSPAALTPRARDGDAPTRTTKNTVTIMWEEEFPPESSTAPSSGDTVPRREIWSTRREGQPPPLAPLLPTSVSTATTQQQEAREPHKLRTDRWEMRVRWRGKRRRERLELEFSENGFLRMVSADNTTSAIGQWELASHGVTWSLPMPHDQLTFHGDLLLNPFGPQPKIIRGVVLRDTSRVWFKPVVATFTADGIGLDTADLSYRNRKSTF